MKIFEILQNINLDAIWNNKESLMQIIHNNPQILSPEVQELLNITSNVNILID